MKATLAAICIIATILALPSTLKAQPADPSAVVKALEAATNAGDLEAQMALFTDDAVIQIRPEAFGGTYTGKEQIRAWFEGLRATHFSITVNIVDVQGDVVTTRSTIASDFFRQIGLASVEGIEQYTVRNGLIAGFTFTFTDESIARIQAAAAPQALPQTGASDGPSLIWLLLGGVALLGGLIVRRRVLRLN
jgi:LPXTG-motif cell wall-anchored protein